MYNIQGDETILEKITDYIINHYNLKVSTKTKVPLRELFPEPKNKWLLSIWRHGHADIAVYRHGKLACIIEPGGSYHLKDDKQKLRDKKKDRLCEVNNVNVLRLINSITKYMDLLVTKKLFKKYIYSMIRCVGVGNCLKVGIK